MTETGKARITGLYHVGLYAQDPAQMAAFYGEVIGMQIVSHIDDPSAQMFFLSSRPDQEAHEIVFTSNRDLAHVAFKVDTLADLRAFHKQIVQKGLPIQMAFNHGASLAFYFLDPEGNLVEIYWPTDLSSTLTSSHPVDLTLSEEEIRKNMVEVATRPEAVLV